jgi:hypothetical protein
MGALTGNGTRTFPDAARGHGRVGPSGRVPTLGDGSARDPPHRSRRPGPIEERFT